MSQQFIKEVKHVAVEPVRIEREHNYVIVIEGVRYAAELFRVFANPDADLLYALERRDDQVVVTPIRNANEAEAFFDDVFLAEAMDPSVAEYSDISPNVRKERGNLERENLKEIDNAI